MDTDTVSDAATVTNHTDTETVAVTLVTTEDAAHLAGVSVRTIRRWIQHGHLSAIETTSGKLVSPADLPEAKKRAGRDRDRSHRVPLNGHDRGHDNMATDADTAMTAPALSSATAQMEAIRDQWLMPLVDRIGALERENGRLEQERDQVTRERDALRAELAAAREPSPVPRYDDITTDAPGESAELPPWRQWLRRITGSGA